MRVSQVRLATRVLKGTATVWSEGGYTGAWLNMIAHAIARIQPGPCLAVALTAGTVLSAQVPDITQPPPIVRSAGQFRARPLGQPPVIDGRAWIAAEVQSTYSLRTVRLRTTTFSLTSSDCGDHDGDLTRCQLLLQQGRRAPVRIDAGFSGWVFVTPDARYIFTEPLYALDVRHWKQYALFEALQIPNYTTIEAISGDGKRLFISRRDCAIDCKAARIEYYELTLP